MAYRCDEHRMEPTLEKQLHGIARRMHDVGLDTEADQLHAHAHNLGCIVKGESPARVIDDVRSMRAIVSQIEALLLAAQRKRGGAEATRLRKGRAAWATH